MATEQREKQQAAAGDGFTAADARLVERIRSAYRPRPLEPARRVALEDDLWRRIEQRRRRTAVLPGLVVATAAMAAVFWWAPEPTGLSNFPGVEPAMDVAGLPVAPVPTEDSAQASTPAGADHGEGDKVVAAAARPKPVARETPEPAPVRAVAAATAERPDPWESRLFDPGLALVGVGAPDPDDESLPPVYEAIALAFLDPR